jgi:hypothetical protein
MIFIVILVIVLYLMIGIAITALAERFCFGKQNPPARVFEVFWWPSLFMVYILVILGWLFGKAIDYINRSEEQ